jgi:membrane-associated protease RseP (regulator of RpoE activity)
MGGMGDEVLEKVEGGEVSESSVPDSRAFDKKPIWARTLVISAGVVMNMVFAFVVYSAVAGIWGMPEFATTRVGQVFQESLLPGALKSWRTFPGAPIWFGLEAGRWTPGET